MKGRIVILLGVLVLASAPAEATPQSASSVAVFVTSAGEVADAVNGFASAPSGPTQWAEEEIRKCFSKWGKKEGVVVVPDGSTAVAVIEYVGLTERALTPPRIIAGSPDALLAALAPTSEVTTSATLVIGEFRKSFSALGRDHEGAWKALSRQMFDFITANRVRLVKP